MRHIQQAVFIFILLYSTSVLSVSVLSKAPKWTVLYPLKSARFLCRWKHDQKPTKAILINTMGNSYDHNIDFTLLQDHLTKYHSLKPKHIKLLSGNGLPPESSYIIPHGDASKASILNTIKKTSTTLANHPKASKKNLWVIIRGHSIIDPRDLHESLSEHIDIVASTIHKNSYTLTQDLIKTIKNQKDALYRSSNLPGGLVTWDEKIITPADLEIVLDPRLSTKMVISSCFSGQFSRYADVHMPQCQIRADVEPTQISFFRKSENYLYMFAQNLSTMGLEDSHNNALITRSHYYPYRRKK